MFVVNIFPKTAKYNPIALASNNANIILGKVDCAKMIPALWVTIGLCIITIFLTMGIFRKKAIYFFSFIVLSTGALVIWNESF